MLIDELDHIDKKRLWLYVPLCESDGKPCMIKVSHIFKNKFEEDIVSRIYSSRQGNLDLSIHAHLSSNVSEAERERRNESIVILSRERDQGC